MWANWTPSPRLATLRLAWTLPARRAVARPRRAEPDPLELAEPAEVVEEGEAGASAPEGRTAGARDGLGVVDVAEGGKSGRGERGGEGREGVEGVSGIEPGPRGGRGERGEVRSRRAWPANGEDSVSPAFSPALLSTRVRTLAVARKGVCTRKASGRVLATKGGSRGIAGPGSSGGERAGSAVGRFGRRRRAKGNVQPRECSREGTGGEGDRRRRWKPAKNEGRRGGGSAGCA